MHWQTLMKKSIAPEKVFLLIGGLFGIIWCFLVPPFQIPDEFNHFCRAYMISQGKVTPANDPVKNLGFYLPQSLRIVEKELGTVPIQFHAEKKQEFDKLRMSMQIKLEEDKTRFILFANTSIYAPIPYLPQAAGIWIGRTLDLPVLYVYYFARLFNLFSFLVFGYWAIKTIPVLKLSVMIIALLPISLHLSASLSADPAILGSSLCFIAYLVFWILEPSSSKINMRAILAFFFLSMVFSLSKAAYYPLCLLFFLIPRNKFKSSWMFWGTGMLLLVANLLIIGAWSIALKGIHIPFSVDPREQIFSIIHQPGIFINKLINTMFSSQHYSSAFTLGWLDTPLPEWLAAVYVSLLAGSGFVGKKMPASADIKWRGVCFLSLFFALCVGLHVALYITWNQLIPGKIDGLQGRYFLPALLLAVVGVQMMISTVFIKRDLTLIYGVVVAVLLAVSSHTLLLRFYNV